MNLNCPLARIAFSDRDTSALALLIIMTETLAVELQLMIVEHLRGQQNKNTLSALSLASRAWRAPSQMLLFEEIKVRFDVPLDAARFQQILQTSAHLCPYVFSLAAWRGSGYWSGVPWINLSQLLCFTALLPRLRTLSLVSHCIDISDPQPDSSLSTLQSRHPLNLNVLGCRFTWNAFIALLELFDVQSICIVNSYPDDVLLDERRLKLSSIKRLDLSMNAGGFSANLRKFSKQLLASCHGLVSLGMDMSLEDADATGALQTFLRTAGQRLERLRLGLRSSRFANGKRATPNLHSFH